MQTNTNSQVNKIVLWVFRILVGATLLTPFLVSRDLLFPFVTTKAFFFRIIVELALPFYLYLLVVDKASRPRLKNSLTILVVAFWLVNLVASLLGVNVVRSLWGNFERMGGTFYLLHLTLLYFYLLFLAQKNGQYFQQFLKLVVFSSSAIALYSVLVALGMRPWVVDPSLPRVSAFFGNPIYLGSFLVLPLTLTLWFALKQEGRLKKFLYGLMAVLQLAAIYVSGTRGAVLGLALGGLLALAASVWFLKGKAKVWGVSLTAVVLLLFIALFAFGSRLSHVKESLRVFDLNDSNAQSRLIQWKTAIAGIKDYPIFGTGPENYYIVANKYYNPAIAKYDRSWFDKPHNYPLEILLTDGLVGLLVFLAMIAFSLLAVFWAYQKRLLSLSEFFVLLAGLLAYQIQNLFVFENISSSLVFYVILAFSAYLWMEVYPPPGSQPPAAASRSNLPLAFSVFFVSACVAAYALYVGNFVPMSISKNVNYGFAYAQVDPQQAYQYFHRAASLPFNFDLGEAGTRYVGFVVNWMQATGTHSPPPELLSSLDESQQVIQRLVAQQPNYPIFLIQLANIDLFKGLETIGQLAPEVITTIERAIDLAPKRTEARQFLIQVRELQKDWVDALALAQLNYQLLPQDPRMLWQVAALTWQAGNQSQAVLLAEQAFSQGYKFASFGEVSWLVDYYNKNQEYQKAIVLYQQAVASNLLGKDDILALFKLYLQTGQRQQAENLAQAVGQQDPSLQAQMQALLKTGK